MTVPGLVDLVRLSLSGNRPSDMFPRALRLIVDQGQARMGMLFVLDLKTGSFERVAMYPESSPVTYTPVWLGNQLSLTVEPDLPVETNDPFSPLIPCVRERIPVSSRAHPGLSSNWAQLGVGEDDNALLLPMLRADTCLGMVLLVRDRPFADRREVGSLAASAQAIAGIYDVRTQYRLLGEMETPLDLRQANDEFFDSVMQLLVKSSGMEFIALRRLEPDGSLTVLKVQKIDANHATVTPDSVIAPPFQSAVKEQRAVSIDSVRIEGLEHGVRALNHDVRSFVVAPIVLGRSREFDDEDELVGSDGPRGRVFGTLSFASRVEYEFSLLERLGFTILANGIGLAIENYENVSALSVLREKQIEAGAALQSQEMAQGFRHEIRKKVDNINGIFATDEPLEDIKNHVHKQTEAIVSVLDEWKNYPGGSQYRWEWNPIHLLWSQALDLAEFQLSDARVQVRGRTSIPKDLRFFSSKDHFIRFVLDGLILNSIDAFRERPSRTSREIRFSYLGSAGDWYVFRYSDNAGGLRSDQVKAAQRRRNEWTGISSRQVLFEAGFTTKAASPGGGGGGYGLYLARSTMGQHDGEIEIIETGEPGAVFELRLPRHRVTT